MLSGCSFLRRCTWFLISRIEMNLTLKQSTSGDYPVPVSHYRILVALFGAPAAWVAQMNLSEPLAAYACYPHLVPLSAPLWADLSTILAVISLVCLAAGLLSGYMAGNLWRQADHRLAVIRKEGHVFEVEGGQTRFLAMLGIMSSFIFIAAILFTCCAVFLVSPCSPWV